jgi:hypothetical protein
MFVRFDQGHGWGYRYLHTAWAFLPIVGGIWIAHARPGARNWCASMIAAGLLATPMFLWQTHQTVAEAVSWRIPAPSSGADWVVFVSKNTGRYRGDLVQNPPGQNHLLHMVSQGLDADRSLMARYFSTAVEVQRDHRGSLWRMPEGTLMKTLGAMTPARTSRPDGGPPGNER